VPKKYGIKEKDLVVEHVMNMMMTGRLRTGDRIDRSEIANDLGISRVPIQEAMVQLEHDGIIASRYHRGAFVERFDAATILEHHEIYGALNGLSAERAAADASGRIIDRLELLLETMQTTVDAQKFQEAAWVYRQSIYNEYAGPRLYAYLRALQSLIPQAFWDGYLGHREEMLVLYVEETDAIRRHDLVAARRVNVRRGELHGRIMIDELRRRGVIGDLRSE
jgi:DNA-binding GntR family transcriptional regulator